MKGYKYDTYNRIFILLFVIVRIKKIEECHKYKYHASYRIFDFFTFSK